MSLQFPKPIENKRRRCPLQRRSGAEKTGDGRGGAAGVVRTGAPTAVGRRGAGIKTVRASCGVVK